MNGKNFVQNDFTCIRPQGCSVVDYCLVSHDDLVMYTEFFGVLRASELINLAAIQAPTTVPDHSMLTWTTSLDSSIYKPCVGPEATYTKFDVRNVPNSFMSDQDFINDVHRCVFNLEQSVQTQEDIDNSYDTLCSVIRHEMESKLPCKRLFNSHRSNKGDELVNHG